jgi:hypothetical protein
MKQIVELLREKAEVESRIRAHRVAVIRQLSRGTAPNQRLQRQITDMEARITRVHYCHTEFDALLEEIEDELGLNINTPKRRRKS